MQGKISMDLSFCQSEEGFSLDELVSKLADVYERKAFSELLKMILQMVQEIQMYRILHGQADEVLFSRPSPTQRQLRASHSNQFGRVQNDVLACELFRVRKNLFAIAAVHSPGTLSDENQ